MARASAWRHVAISLVVGSALGVLWFGASLQAKQRGMLKDYVKSTLTVNIRGEKGTGIYPSLADDTRIPHGEALRRIQSGFGGRSLPFVVRQLIARVLVCSVVVAGLLFALFISYGRYLARKQHLRGCKMVDTKDQKQRWVARRLALALGGGVSLSLALQVLRLGKERLALLDDYALTVLCDRAATVGRWLSPDFDGKLLWYDLGGESGFRASSKMLGYLHAVFDGRGITDLLVQTMGHALVAAAVLAPPLLRRRRALSDDGALQLGDVRIPRKVHAYHMFVCGSPGSGKSTGIKELLDQIRARGERAIVYDCSGEYVEPYCRPGHDLILNPLDARSERWTPWADAWSDESYYTMGRALFPQEGKDPFWADAGAQLWAFTARVLNQNGAVYNSSLTELLLEASPKVLHKALEGTAAARLVDKAAGAMPQNLLATVTSKLAGWKCLPDPDVDHPAFSVREYVNGSPKDDDRWLFLTTREDQHDTLRPMLSLWCDIAAGSILSRPPDRTDRLWFVLDEVASLQKLPALPHLLERGRKHGAAAILGLQSIAQLRTVYGRDGAAALAAQPQTWLVLRTVEPETARWLENALGAAEHRERHESVSMGAEAARDGVSLQQRNERQSVVLASEIINLPDLVGYLNLPGNEPIRRIRCQLKDRPRISTAHVPPAGAELIAS